jgi:hypothetical protein
MEVTGNYWIASFGNGLASGRLHRQRGEPCGAATRNAERPKGEKWKLASRLPGNSYGRFARRADGKGPRERYLASRLSYLGYPFSNEHLLEHRGAEDARGVFLERTGRG